MATTTTDDGFHEIQLNGKQLVFLFMAVVVVSVVIFLCGVLVGRGVRAESRRPIQASRPPRRTDAVAEPPRRQPPSGSTPRTANEDLSYPNRLANRQAPHGTAPQPADAAGRAAGPAPPRHPRAAMPNQPCAAPATPRGCGAARLPAPREPGGAGFAIQVAALRQREEADGVVRASDEQGLSRIRDDARRRRAGGLPRARRQVQGSPRGGIRRRAAAEEEEQFKPWIVR